MNLTYKPRPKNNSLKNSTQHYVWLPSWHDVRRKVHSCAIGDVNLNIWIQLITRESAGSNVQKFVLVALREEMS
jgi:hypothetical protein